ncbi:MAG TPA: helix-turn-helix domain-containing protein [Paenirhodobacter sp.]
MDDDTDRTVGIQVIARAATILRLLGEEPDGLSLAAIASRVGLARSTVQRIVQALQAEELVERAGAAGGVRLGPALEHLIFRKRIDIVTVLRPALAILGHDLQETIALCELAGNRIVTIDRFIAEQPLRVVFPLGAIPIAPHKLAPGLVIMSVMTPADAEAALSASLGQDADTDGFARIQPVLDETRRAGFASDEAFGDNGMAGFAVSLQTHFGVHALAAIVPVARAAKRRDDIISALNVAKVAITKRIGA